MAEDVPVPALDLRPPVPPPPAPVAAVLAVEALTGAIPPPLTPPLVAAEEAEAIC